MSLDLSTLKSTAPLPKAAPIRIAYSRKLSDKKKEVFYRELGMLLKSGVDFKKALEIMTHQSVGKLERTIITQIKDRVTAGISIFDSMRETGHFSAYEYYSVRIGEETRKLEEVLEELRKYFGRKIQMKRQIVSVLTYPAIVMLVTLLVLYFMLNKVVPMFSSVFRQFGNELPASTRMIIKVSQHSGMLFTIFTMALVGIVALHLTFREKQSYRAFTSHFVLKIPYFGNLIRKIYISRFCQAMHLLVTSRTSLLNALSLTAKMVGFYPIESAIVQIQQDITKGASLSESLKKHDVFEYRLTSMIEVAEQVNELDTMFSRLTEQYNDEISHQTKMIGVVLEPMIIVVIGIIVGVIMVSMYAPMFDLSKIIKN